MKEEDANNIRIFRVYKKLPRDIKNELHLLLSPEILLGVETHIITNEVEENFNKVITDISSMHIDDLKDIFENDKHWIHKFAYTRFIKQVKTYLQLRPNVLEDYPEFLI